MYKRQFLLFAFFLGFAIMIGAELNAAIEEEFPAPAPHAEQVRTWLRRKATSKGGSDTEEPQPVSEDTSETAPVSPS